LSRAFFDNDFLNHGLKVFALSFEPVFSNREVFEFETPITVCQYLNWVCMIGLSQFDSHLVQGLLALVFHGTLKDQCLRICSAEQPTKEEKVPQCGGSEPRTST